jgi:hypothetical protein
MAEDGQTTPEKQLLKLIEDPQPVKDAKQGSARAPRMRSGSFSLRGLRGAWMGRLSFFNRLSKKKTSALSSKTRSINLPTINKILAAVAVSLFAYLVFDVVASAINSKYPPNLNLKGVQAAQNSEIKSSPLKESAFYLQKAASRDLFKEGGAPVEKAAKKEAVSVDENPATSGLSLVGISWSANPDVIIEDKTSKRTFFVKRGQPLSPGVKVEAIFKDRVVLSYEGQEFELR